MPSRQVLAIVAALLGLTGVGAIGFAASRQQHPPEPPLTAALGSARPGATATATATASASTSEPSADSADDEGSTASVPSGVAPRRAAPSSKAARKVPAAATRPIAPVLSASAPVLVTIPAIGVSSALLTLGQNRDGSLEVPPRGPTYDQAGWYRHSPTPGAIGPAVIVGHVDSASGGPSVFYRLADLHPNDTVLVTRADGSIATFAVDAVSRYAKNDFPTEAVYGNTDHAALRLITCGGPFDRASGHYRDNIVVTASLLRRS